MTRPRAVVVTGDPVREARAAFPGCAVTTEPLPSEPFDLATSGTVWALTVSNPEDAATALVAVSRGATTTIALRLDAAASASFLDDLRRAADVRTDASAPPEVRLGPDHVELLAAVAEGCSLEEVAARLSMSRRTVARRLAEARSALDAPTTVEAVRAALGLGLLRS